MGGFSVASENLAVGAISAAGTWISLHTGDPGATGLLEVTGGTYARKAVTWGSVSNSAVTAIAGVTIDVPAGTTITWWGLSSTVTGGTFYFGGLLPASETFGSNGTYSLTPTLSASD